MKKYQIPASLLAALIANFLSRRTVGVVEATPFNTNSKKDSNSLNSLACRHGASRRVSSENCSHKLERRQANGSSTSSSKSVALDDSKDSIPCESYQWPSSPRTGKDGGASSVGNNNEGDTASSAADFSNTNSFMPPNITNEMKSPTITSTTKDSFALNYRGGATVIGKPHFGDPSLDDDVLDQLVDDLIAGMDEGDENEGLKVDEDEDGADDKGQIIEGDEIVTEKVSENREEDDTDACEMDTRKFSEESRPKAVQKHFENCSTPPIQSNAQSPPNPLQRPASMQSSSHSTPSMPTNAYYRFLARRGPKGHILAAFTIIMVQWIYTFTPVVYQSIASILLKLCIYNPQILYEKDRRGLSRMKYSLPKKGKLGLTTKIFGCTSKIIGTSASQQVNLQEDADKKAADKLRQLYKTTKTGNGVIMRSEVKYRYLSVAFRKRHGLGKEYRVEKPLTFMGEVVEGRAGDGAVMSSEILDEGIDDDIVFLDKEFEEGVKSFWQGSKGSGIGGCQGAGSQKGMLQQHQQHVERNKINDWVVDAFATSEEKPLSAIWMTVKRGAILDAAWKSRAVEQWTKSTRKGAGSHGCKTVGESLHSNPGIKAAASGSNGSGGYSASKMFHSVMTRVGSNGRIFGAYPNDALPIEKCANEKGVVQLARKYGYGDWRASDSMGYDKVLMQSNYEYDRNDSWGAGDLIFGEEDESDLPPPRDVLNHGRKRQWK